MYTQPDMFDTFEPVKDNEKLPDLKKAVGTYPEITITGVATSFTFERNTPYTKINLTINKSEGATALPAGTKACVMIYGGGKSKKFADQELARAAAAMVAKPVGAITGEHLKQLKTLDFYSTTVKVAAEVTPEDEGSQYNTIRWAPFTSAGAKA